MKRTRQILALLVLSLAACAPVKEANAEPTQEPALQECYTAGEYTATAKGFGGDVTVTMTFSTDAILTVDAAGDSETQGIGSRAIEELPKAILDAQDVAVDTVSGATVSSMAVLTAARQCMARAAGTEVAEVKLVPGTYTGSATGYFKVNPVVVNVTVDESKIVDVTIEDGNDESYGMMQSVKTNLLPRMIENNSVVIDAITGATATSNAVKLAATEALTEALKASGSELSPAEVFDGTIEKKNETITLDTDILVVGLGGSGLAALASSAQQANGALSVMAIEKAGIYGGTSQMTCDVFAVNPPEMVKERNGGKDYQDPTEMHDNWLAYTTGTDGEQNAKVEMVDLLFEESGNTVDWLTSYCGFNFRDPVGGFTAADYYITKFQYSNGYSLETRTETQGYYKAMVERAEALGAKVYLETEAYGLLTDASGAITGVKAHNLVDGTEYVINAKAVIMATGGFAGNAEMMERYIDSEYFPFSGGWGVVGSTQNKGYLMQSAIDLGAATYNMNMPPEWHNAATRITLSSREVVKALEGDTHNMFLPQAYSLNDLPTTLGSSSNVLQVNKLGQRFCDETVMFRPAESGNIFYGIRSQADLDKIAQNGLTSQKYSGFVNIGGWYLDQPIPEVYDIVEEAISLGIAYKADSIEELAEKIGVPADTLMATVARYNELCAAGVDEDYGKDAQYLDAIEGDGPFYAFEIQEYIYNTLGGLDVDEAFRVLDTNGSAMNGLYAVGNDSTGVLFSNEKVYPTYGGMDMSWCYTSGRLAGENAVDYVKGLSK